MCARIDVSTFTGELGHVSIGYKRALVDFLACAANQISSSY